MVGPKEVIRGEKRNISLVGAFIHCHTDLEGDQPVSIAIKTPFGAQVLFMKAERVWSNIPACEDDLTLCGVGVRFSQLNSENYEHLSNVIAEHLQGVE